MKIFNKINSITFGTTEREVQRKLHPDTFSIKNCNYFVRPYEPTPTEISDYIAAELKDAKSAKMKVWGCSDLSSFLVRKIALIKKLGFNNFEKIFGNIELIDIDKEIIIRAQKGLIGVLDNDFKALQDLCDIDLKKYLKLEKNNSDFFLEGEPKFASSWIEEESRFSNEPIKPYKISSKLMRGLNIRVGDIRKDLNIMPLVSKGTKQIFDFSNSWYFMHPEDQVKLAEKLSTKMNIGDILIVGAVELEHNVDYLLEAFGFKHNYDLMGVFKKNQNFTKAERRNIKKIASKIFAKKF